MAGKAERSGETRMERQEGSRLRIVGLPQSCGLDTACSGSKASPMYRRSGKDVGNESVPTGGGVHIAGQVE